MNLNLNYNNMELIRLDKDNYTEIIEMSTIATAILKDYYDNIVGPVQNDYMLNKFQSIDGITDQLNHNYQYYFINVDKVNIGFIAYYKKGKDLYLSKLYINKENRGKGYLRSILDYLINYCNDNNLGGIELNVNKHNPTCMIYEHLGFKKIRSECNDIGSGYYMDDYVYYYKIEK